jgi:hypothetical protein
MAIALAVAALSAPCLAGTVATIVDYELSGDRNTGEYSLGWEFGLSAPVTVTALGFWDYEGDGFHAASGGLTSVDVGIYDLSGNLLLSAEVLSSDPASNQLADGSVFRFHTLGTSLVLGAGDYVIAGANLGEGYLFQDPGDVTFDPAVQFLGNRVVASATLVYPSSVDCCISAAQPGWFGPNFQIGSGVPEPGSILLALAGLGLVGFLRRAWRP